MHQGKLKVRAALKETEGLDFTFLVTGPYPSAVSGMYLSSKSGNAEAEVMGSWDVVGKKAVLVEGENKVAFTTVGELVHPHIFSDILT